jgi:dipeptidyl aminopeptidase/acylaminoacyl peptidase
MRIWITFILLTLLTLTACVSPSSTSPTPTIVRLDYSALMATAPAQAAEATLPVTALPLPSSTPAEALAAETATATLQPKTLATPTPTITATTITAQAEIISTGLNVRAGPGTNYATIATVAKGDILEITSASANGDWLQIVTPAGKLGWISGQSAYTRILGSLNQVPLVTAVTGAQATAAVAGQSSPVASTSRLVFATSSGGDLYRVNIVGAGLQKLASGVIDPVVSPDGTQVAYSRWDGANMGALYVLNLNSGSEHVIASDIRQPKSPTWAQDGQTIIISFQHGGTIDPQPECRKFDRDDGFQLPNISEITSQHHYADGSIKICFIRAEDLQWGLRQVNVTTGAIEDLPADLYSFNPTWDPQNSARVIYDGQRGLMQLNVITGELQSFTNDVRDTGPVFSPGGQKLALTYKQHDHWEVYTYDLASGSRHRLTKPPLLADPQYSSAAPAWSPDGLQIAFITDRSGRWEIWVMNADGSSPHPLLSTEVQTRLDLNYQGVNERLLNWIP